MTTSIAPKWTYFILILVGASTVLLLINNILPMIFKVVFSIFSFIGIVVCLRILLTRYHIDNDSITTKGWDIGYNQVFFKDVDKAYMFVNTSVSKNESEKSSRLTYTIQKSEHIGIELKNGAVMILNIAHVSDDFLQLLEEKFDEYAIYYFEMK